MNPARPPGAVHGEHNPIIPLSARITDIRRDTEDTWTFRLVFDDPAIQAAYRFLPGQFNMISVYGYGEAPISMSSDPAEAGFVEHTIRAVGNLTNAIARLRVGDRVGLRGPYGSPWPVDALAGQDVGIVAGGIGLAPLRPLLMTLFARRAEFGRLILLCGAKTPADLLFTGEYDAWERAGGLTLHTSADRCDPDWTGRAGVVTTLIPLVEWRPERTTVVVCGPEIMMTFVLADFQKMGIPDERLILSMERHMSCAVGFCGRCQYGPFFLCRQGPVFTYDQIKPYFGKAV